MTKSPTIIYTKTDEAPALATHAQLRFARGADGTRERTGQDPRAEELHREDAQQHDRRDDREDLHQLPRVVMEPGVVVPG